MAAANSGKRQRGVSLLEAMLATSIAGVLSASAVPQLSNLMAHQRLRTASSDLFATFNLARSEAIRRASPVAVIPADAQNWSTGWKVFADRNDNGALDQGEETIVERRLPAKTLSIKPYFGATFSGEVLSYTSVGRLHRPGGQGLVIGRLVIAQEGAARSLCFASLRLRTVPTAICPS